MGKRFFLNRLFCLMCCGMFVFTHISVTAFSQELGETNTEFSVEETVETGKSEEIGEIVESEDGEVMGEADEIDEAEESISLFAISNIYVDEDGNELSYVVDDNGNVTITQIRVSGGNLTIPSMIEGDPVTAVASEQSCVVINPETKITQLTVDCEMVGCNAFKGTMIGTLVLGENVSSFEQIMVSNGNYPVWGQFTDSTINQVVFRATELNIAISQYTNSRNCIGPFDRASIGNVVIGDDVSLIPENLFRNAVMELGEVYLNADRIGANAFSGENIHIEHLIIGENVRTLEEESNSSNVNHYWQQFANTTIDTVTLNAVELDLGHTFSAGSINYAFSPFQNAVVGTLEIGELVTKIPEAFMKQAKLHLENLELHVKTIGAFAFSGEEIEMENLVLGTEVEEFEESYYSSGVYHYRNQFEDATIGTFMLYAKSISYANVKSPGQTNYVYGPFRNAIVFDVWIDSSVEAIPEYLFYEAKIDFGIFYLHTPIVGAYAFAGAKNTFDSLIIGSEVTTFAESFVSNSINHYWNQFMDCSIAYLEYSPCQAELIHNVSALGAGTTNISGAFNRANIGELFLTESVYEVPDYLFYNASMMLETLFVNTPVIGFCSFYSKNIVIDDLYIGEAVTTFATNSSGNNLAFDYCDIGRLHFMAVSSQLEQLTNNGLGPFADGCVIGELEIDKGVTVIPYGCFRNAKLELDVVTIENADIGYGAFSGSGITIHQLNIGNNVSYVGLISNQMNCFRSAKIQELNYNSNRAPVSWVTGVGSGAGMFAYADIGLLNIGEDVEVIPEYWFYSATMKQEELIVPCNWGPYAFNSSNIEIERLELCGDFEHFFSRSNRNYGFVGGKYGTVVYDIPFATYDSDTFSTYGIFGSNAITDFEVSGRVSYIDNKILKNLSCTNCYVYAVFAEEEYASQSFSTGDLPVCENLFIHHNSDFKYLFETKASETNWMCEDCFDKTYGEKIFNEETGNYDVTVYKLCIVCGYEEESVEELDLSYDLYISIPVNFELIYDSEKKSYCRDVCVYAYGRLGDAHGGVYLCLDTENSKYGVAVMGEQEFDLSPYLTVELCNDGNRGEWVCYEREQISLNTAVLEGTSDLELYTSQMEVSIRGAAFTQGGAGEYQIQIPLIIEFF